MRIQWRKRYRSRRPVGSIEADSSSGGTKWRVANLVHNCPAIANQWCCNQGYPQLVQAGPYTATPWLASNDHPLPFASRQTTLLGYKSTILWRDWSYSAQPCCLNPAFCFSATTSRFRSKLRVHDVVLYQSVVRRRPRESHPPKGRRHCSGERPNSAIAQESCHRTPVPSQFETKNALDRRRGSTGKGRHPTLLILGFFAHRPGTSLAGPGSAAQQGFQMVLAGDG